MSELDNLPPPPPAPRAAVMRKFTCPNCGGEVAIRAAGHTLSAVCSHCGSVIDVSDERLKVIQEVSGKLKQRPTFLEIGQRGSFDGVTYEIVGYVQKSDRTKIYYWDEYLLFNPYHGFRFLVQMDGHWNFVTIVKRDIDKVGFVTTVWVGDLKFDPFLQDEPIVQYVKGEFYWRVKRGDKAKTEDYICPPYMLSIEGTGADTTVSMCEYKEPEEIRNAFALKVAMPNRTGVGPNQPSPVDFRAVLKVAVIAFLLLTMLHFINSAGAANEQLTFVSSSHVAGDQSKTFTSAPFQVTAQSNVLISSYATVSNSWVELYVSLVNQDTKEVFEVRQPIEYYFGSDSDGSWTEGSTRESDYMSGVTPGTYRLVYELEADAFTRGLGGYKLGGATNPSYQPTGEQGVGVTIRATRDVPSSGNYWFTLLFFLVCPVYSGCRSVGFETRRWENSDFPRGES